MMKVRLVRLLLLLGMFCPAANGSYISFNQGTHSSVTFGTDGSLSGSFEIVGIGSTGTTDNANAALTFSLTGPASDGNGGYTYTGGSFTLAGYDYSLSETPEQLLTGQIQSGSDLKLLFQYDGENNFQMNGLFQDGSIASDLAAFFGDPIGEMVGGTFEIYFTQLAGTTTYSPGSQVVVQSFSVPEPSSAAMAILGLTLFGVWRGQEVRRFRILSRVR
jgi:hypothetical protein